MAEIQINDFVRLNRDFPEHGLRCGAVGVVCGKSKADPKTVEVEFDNVAGDQPVCLTLTLGHLMLDESALFNHDYLENSLT